MIAACLYCKQVETLTEEHVLPECHGGKDRIPLVCERCRFSWLDQALAERSFLAFARLRKLNPSVHGARLGALFTHKDPNGFAWTNAHFRNDKVRILPTISVDFGETDGDEVPFRAECRFSDKPDDLSNMVHTINKKMGKRKFWGFRPEPSLPDNVIVLTLENKDRVLVQAKSTAIKEARLPLIKRLWGQYSQHLLSSTPQLVDPPQGVLTGAFKFIDPTVESRALAKIAFNVMALEFGRDFALSQEFDGIREFIRSGATLPPPMRVVTEIMGAEMFVPAEHLFMFVCLVHRSGDLYLACDVNLYGRSVAAILLGKLPTGSLTFQARCREFFHSRVALSESHSLDSLLVERVINK